MNNFWRWFFGIVAGLAVIGLLLAGRSERQAYRIGRDAIHQRVEAQQARVDKAVESATAAVDHALQLAGNLPSQQAQADLVKADIEEIGNRLNEAAEARGDAAVAALDQSIEQFNTTLENVEKASNEATDSRAKATLDRIYNTLLAARDRLTEAVLNTQQ
jgi:uncharacterized protein YicC (UPF0701 family)